MSHNVQREEKDCLNCKALVQGRFCQNCGQENVVIRAGFWSMAKHFIYDLLHFEGTFFRTVKLLFVKPGKVAREYVNGKRAAHVDPIRMYLFVSALTFFLLPLFTNLQSALEKVHIMATPSDRLTEVARTYRQVKYNPVQDSASKKLDVLLETSTLLLLESYNDTTTKPSIDMYISGTRYKAIPVKESVAFSGRNWIEGRVSKNMQKELQKEGGDFNQLINTQNKTQWKMMPYLLFLSLPIFSFLLKAIYSNNKRLYYSDHAVFTLYHYILAFCILLFALLISPLVKLLHLPVAPFVHLPLFFLGLLYLFLEMKYFYGESWVKTVIKFLVLMIGSFIAVGLLYALLLFGMLLF